MIVVTGGAGFIGSNLVHALSARGDTEVVVVDDFERGIKFRNLTGARFADVLDKHEFRRMVERDDDALRGVRAVFHQGACSSTTEWNGRYLLDNNYAYSKAVSAFCDRHGALLVYASSAAVYGGSPIFREAPEHEAPLNAYGWSKQIFDGWMRRRGFGRTVGLRYFNVYGPREAHKGTMASVAFHLDQQLRETGKVRIFGEYGGCDPGEQRRDFIHVDDVVAANLHFLDNPGPGGLFNVGTGRAQTFNEIARAVIAHHGHGEIEYIPFPEHLRGRYQTFTQADVSRLRQTGFTRELADVATGVSRYLRWLEQNPLSRETSP
ncbi:MAG: ADP-glyceromanno-heptose 6-epimerase [Polyangiaceae bacterium]